MIKEYSHSTMNLLKEITVWEFYDYAKRHHELDLEPKKKEIKPYAKTLNDLDAIEPESHFMVEPLFEEGEFIIISAEQKVGKTLLAMDFSLMIASRGSIGNRLLASESYKVLYIDTEMQENKFKSRINKLKVNYKNQDQITHNYRFFCVQSNRNKLDLSKIDDQQWIEDIIQDAKFIVFDNLGGLLPYGAEKNEACWEPVSNWFKSLTSRGITVFLVHHLNKNGEQRGTGKITDDVDLAILLKRSADCPDTKTVIEFHISHARHLHGSQREPFSIEYYEENKVIKRIIRTSDIEQEEHNKSLIKEIEITQYSLSGLQVEMLKTARAPQTEYITAGKFKTGAKGRSKTTITNGLTDLYKKGLLKKIGSGSGSKYYPTTSSPSDI